MTQKTYFIHAHDLWMFRDSRPFNAQQNFVARSMFPPNPQVVYGFMRGHILEQSDTSIPQFKKDRVPDSLQTVIGTKETHGNLRIHSIYPARQFDNHYDRLYPVPADVLVRKDPVELDNFAILSPAKNKAFVTNVPFEGWRPLLLSDIDNQYESVSGWLDTDNLHAYLRGENIQTVIQSDALYQKDERVGLALNHDTKTARESFLYHAEFVRPHANTPYMKENKETRREGHLVKAYDPNAITGLLITVSGDDDLIGDRGIIATGGESRFAYYQQVQDLSTPYVSNLRGQVKMILQTPAYFTDGWEPANGWDELMGSARLVSFAINGYDSISGWNMANNTPRPMRRLVPAGSVFYFDNVTDLPQAFTEDDGDDYPFAQMGFGSYIATTFDYQSN